MRIPMTALLFLIPVLSGLAAPAPAANDQAQAGATLMGCLQKAELDDSYTLDGGTGDRTVITGPQQLDSHIGHLVKLTGEETRTAGHPVFTVHDIQQIASTCSQSAVGAERVARARFVNPDNKVIGEATLLQSNQGVLIEATFTDLPRGRHALHIHEHGQCDAPDFKSAGGHFNPSHAEHGLANPEGPHSGDMPNFTASAGKTVVEIYNDRVTLEKGAANSLLKDGGAALVVHAREDDYKSDPAGDAGKRIACAVIEATQPGSVQAKEQGK